MQLVPVGFLSRRSLEKVGVTMPPGSGSNVCPIVCVEFSATKDGKSGVWVGPARRKSVSYRALVSVMTNSTFVRQSAIPGAQEVTVYIEVVVLVIAVGGDFARRAGIVVTSAFFADSNSAFDGRLEVEFKILLNEAVCGRANRELESDVVVEDEFASVLHSVNVVIVIVTGTPIVVEGGAVAHLKIWVSVESCKRMPLTIS